MTEGISTQVANLITVRIAKNQNPKLSKNPASHNGRRNLTDFQRNEIALKYEGIVSRQMKEVADKSRSEFHGNQHTTVVSGPNDHNTTTRKELAKIAGTSEGSVQRTKLILEKGTPEQTGRQLTKTELVQMALAVEKQVAVEAEVKMKAGVKDPSSNLNEGGHVRTASKAAESIGVSENTYRDMKLVAEKGSDEQIERMNKGGRGFFSKSW